MKEDVEWIKERIINEYRKFGGIWSTEEWAMMAATKIAAKIVGREK